MRISPIMITRNSLKNNFKGLFTDASHKNNGNWRMEYRPYSWEKNLNDTFGMATQEEWSILDKTLPDNEKHFVDITQYSRGKKYCRDILETEFYYCDYDKNRERKVITEMPAMNLEDSLVVRNKKLKTFMERKKIYEVELKNKLNETDAVLKDLSTEFMEYSNDYFQHLWLRKKTPNQNKFGMDDVFHKYEKATLSMKENLVEQLKLKDSMYFLNAEILEGQQTIKILKDARVTDNLIDISKRDVYDPNKPLWDALQNIKTAAGKIIALPHKVLSMHELINKIGKVGESEFASKGIKIVDQMIKFKL